MKFWKKALLVVLACAALGTLGPIQRGIAQGVINLSTITGTEQITGIGYPCVISCYATTKQIAQYAASQAAGPPNAQTGTTYTVLASDAGKLVTFSNTSAIAITLPAATTSGFGSGTVFEFANLNTGAATITPTTSTINGSATLVLNQNRSVFVISDGTNYQVSVGGSGTLVTPGTVAEGGTGRATLTNHGVLIGAGTTAITQSSVGATGTLLQGATGADPTFATTLSGAYTFTNPLIATGIAAGTPTHIATQQNTAPALTSCGTGSPAITGTDTMGIVTMGTGATGCIITFNVAYTGTPVCLVNWIATPLASQSWTTSNAAITTTQTNTSGNKLVYFCTAPSGG